MPNFCLDASALFFVFIAHSLFLFRTLKAQWEQQRTALESEVAAQRMQLAEDSAVLENVHQRPPMSPSRYSNDQSCFMCKEYEQEVSYPR
jgi:hypothetical protein